MASLIAVTSQAGSKGSGAAAVLEPFSAKALEAIGLLKAY